MRVMQTANNLIMRRGVMELSIIYLIYSTQLLPLCQMPIILFIITYRQPDPDRLFIPAPNV